MTAPASLPLHVVVKDVYQFFALTDEAHLCGTDGPCLCRSRWDIRAGHR